MSEARWVNALYPPLDHAREAGEITAIPDVPVAQPAQQCDAGLALVVAMLQEQPSASGEVARRRSGDALDALQPGGTRLERAPRLEAQVTLNGCGSALAM